MPDFIRNDDLRFVGAMDAKSPVHVMTWDEVSRWMTSTDEVKVVAVCGKHMRPVWASVVRFDTDPLCTACQKHLDTPAGGSLD